MEPWRIDLMGELRATRGTWSVTHFRTQKTAALLAHLAFFRDRSHPRELLVGMLWPDASSEAGRNNLSQALSALRHQLEPPGVEPGSVLVGTRATVQLAEDAVATDTDALREALERASREKGKKKEELLERALEVPRGELLPGFYLEWIAPERERLRAACVAAARELAAIAERAGDPSRALDRARRALAFDPLAEDAHRDVIRLLAASGDPLRALKHFEEMEARFEKELGHGPTRETRELARGIERAHSPPPREAGGRPGASKREDAPPTTTLPPPRGVRAPAVTTLLATPDASAGALVARYSGEVLEETGTLVASFARPSDALACALAARAQAALETGDRDLRARARELLAAAKPRQILCSEETAVLLRRDLEAGINLTDLGVFKLGGASARLFQAHREGESLLAPAAERVHAGGLPLDMSAFHGREEELERLRQELAPGRRGLVTLTGPGGIGKTRLAVETATRLQEAFRGEAWFVPLASVTEPRVISDALRTALRLPPGPGDPLERVAERLGRGPALLVLDNFEQLVREGAAVVKALLERAPSLSVLATSRQRLGLDGEREIVVAPLPLPRGPDTPESLARVASVRIFVDRARAVRPDFELTSETAKGVGELVRRLEGIPLALALAAGRAQVLSPEQILARLSGRLDLLVSRSKDVPERHASLRAAIEGSTSLLAPPLTRFLALLSVFRGGFTLEAAEAVTEDPLALDALAELRECSFVTVEGERFSMLETLREYAREQLGEDERDRVALRHARYFAALAERAAPLLVGPEQGKWLDRLETEQGNMRAAIEEGGDGEAALRIAGALRHHWIVRGPIAEGRRLVAFALERSKARTAARAQALMGAGGLAHTQADTSGARASWEEALEIARELGDRSTVSRALNNLGIVATIGGDYARARQRLEESARIAREIGDGAFAARSVLNLAIIAKNEADFPRARALLDESARLSDGAGDRLNAAKARRMLGDLCVEVNDYDAAARHFQDALSVFESLGAREDVALSLHSLARIDSRHGRDGAPRLERAVAILREIGARVNLPVILLALATHSEPERARALLDEALAIARADRNRLAESHVLAAQGDIARRQGDPRARALYGECLARLRELGAKAYAAGPLESLAALDAAEGRADRAARLLGAAEVLREASGAASPGESRERDATLARVRDRLGPGFEGARAAGRALSFEGALELASLAPGKIPDFS
ncbi:MAG TPA: tetratricopeptide repeat protein [Planctomycetota bacterium]|nr:tetratricopeptide repeat protein [Planctomycetota bacterium]